MNLLIRTDADAEIGTGHVMRCLALAGACRDQGGTPTFACASLPSGLEARMMAEQVRIVRLQQGPDDVVETADLARNLGAAWVVIDGYRFDARFQKGLKQAGFRVLTIDDTGCAGRYSADLILNQNLHGAAALYADREPGTSLLLGLSYVLLRREFWAKPRRVRATPEGVTNLLITLGGSDPGNYTARVLRSLGGGGGFRTRVVLGAANHNGAAVLDVIREIGSEAEVLTDARDMRQVMEWADLAIASGGTSVWELAFLGVPTVAFSQGTQETMLLDAAESNGLCVFGGRWADLTSERLERTMKQLLPSYARLEMAKRQQETVDGHGARRVLAVMGE